MVNGQMSSLRILLQIILYGVICGESLVVFSLGSHIQPENRENKVIDFNSGLTSKLIIDNPIKKVLKIEGRYLFRIL